MEKHKEQVRTMLIDKWAEFQYKNELAKEIERYLIFDAPEHNIHLPIDGIYGIVLEIQSELAEVGNYMSGNYVITPAVYGEGTELKGEIVLVSREVIYVPSTKADLLKYVSEDILTLAMGAMDWKTFKASFKTE